MTRAKISWLFLGVVHAWMAAGEAYAVTTSSAYAQPSVHAAFTAAYVVMGLYAFVVAFKADWLNTQLIIAQNNYRELMESV